MNLSVKQGTQVYTRSLRSLSCKGHLLDSPDPSGGFSNDTWHGWKAIHNVNNNLGAVRKVSEHKSMCFICLSLGHCTAITQPPCCSSAVCSFASTSGKQDTAWRTFHGRAACARRCLINAIRQWSPVFNIYWVPIGPLRLWSGMKQFYKACP